MLLRSLIAGLMCCLGQLSWAQTTAQETLVVPITHIPPFLTIDELGQPSGYNADIARAISIQSGIPIEFREYPTFRDGFLAVVSGEASMVAGVNFNRLFSENVLFSDVVTREDFQIAVLTDRKHEFENGLPDDAAVGVATNVTYAQDREALSQYTVVDFLSAQETLMALLAGQVDAVLLPNNVTYGFARQAGFDGRVTHIGQPIRERERIAVVNQQYEHLMPTINEAIAALELNGTLDAINDRYQFNAPTSDVDALIVGVTNFPPYQYWENGEATGFAVEVMSDLGRQLGIKINYIPISREQFAQGPQPNTYDALPSIGVSETRRKIMDFAYPIEIAEYSIFYRAGEGNVIEDYSDLADLRIGVGEAHAGNAYAQSQGIGEVVPYSGTRDDLLDALVNGEVDVILYGTRQMNETIAEAGLENVIVSAPRPYFTSTRAPALRFGLGVTRERFNRILPGYVVSQAYVDLHEKYFGTPRFWTPVRLAILAATIGVIALISLLWLTRLLNDKRKQAERASRLKQSLLETEQRHSGELKALVKELERTNRELNDFAYIASHDLKEPLRGISINADFLKREHLTDAAARRVERMGKLARRMDNLVSDLLQYSRLSNTAGPKQTIAVETIIDGIRYELAEWLEERSGEIVVVSDLPNIRFDKSKAKTLFQNLIVNGIKYNQSPRRTVEVGFLRSIYVNGTTLEKAFFVRDNGIGIEEAYREKVFRIFSRLNKRTEFENDTGTGSGLAFVKKILGEQNGKIDFVSEPGNGTTFYFTLSEVEAADGEQQDAA